MKGTIHAQADTGIPKLDRLLNDKNEPPLVEGANDPAVGVVHDLVNRFDPALAQLNPLLPKGWKKARPAARPSANEYAVYGAKTKVLVSAFQKLSGLAETGNVDHATATTLLATKKEKALVTPAELIFSHGLKYSHFLKAVVLTAGQECRFDFTVMNPNTDGAGLSLGILHWAQKPKRLFELMAFLRLRSPTFSGVNVMDLIFGGTAEMDRVIAHLERAKDGLDAKGNSLDPELEFANPPMAIIKYWPNNFKVLLGVSFAQAAMIEMATKTYRKLYDNSYPDYPGDPNNLGGRNLKVWADKLKSERAVAFTLDMLNQHGGKVRTYYQQYVQNQPDAMEQQILENLRDRAAKFWLDQKGPTLEVRQKNAAADSRRRNLFLNTPNLSSQVDFDPA